MTEQIYLELWWANNFNFAITLLLFLIFCVLTAMNNKIPAAGDNQNDAQPTSFYNKGENE